MKTYKCDYCLKEVTIYQTILRQAFKLIGTERIPVVLKAKKCTDCQHEVIV